MNRAQGVVIGLDIGTRRIGVARGDLAVGIATPLAAIGNDNETFEQLKKIISQDSLNFLINISSFFKRGLQSIAPINALMVFRIMSSA